jgi:hypothetical protein
MATAVISSPDSDDKKPTPNDAVLVRASLPATEWLRTPGETGVLKLGFLESSRMYGG